MHKGDTFLSPKRALRILRLPGAPRVHPYALVKWAKMPCLRLGGKILGGKQFLFNPKGRSEWWFRENDILALKQALLREAQANRGTPKGFPDVLQRRRQEVGLSQPELAARVGVSSSTIQNWESGKGQPRPPADEALSEVLGVSPKQLKITEWGCRRPSSPQHSFDGVFCDDNGQVSEYSIPECARQSGISEARLYRFVKRLPKEFCSIFPDQGVLPSVLKRAPGTTNFGERAIRPADLSALITGIADILHGGPRSPNLRTADEICDQHGIDGFDRFWVRKLLKTLARNNAIKANRLPRKQIKGLRGWSSPWVYDASEVCRCLGGRSLEEVVQAFALHRDWDYSLPACRIQDAHEPAPGLSSSVRGLSETEEAIIQATTQQIAQTGESASAQQIANQLDYKNNSYFRDRLARLGRPPPS